MSRHVVAGIDIGTSETKVIIAEGVVENGHFSPRIIGTGSAESRGVEKGFIASVAEVAESVRAAAAKAEKAAGVRPRRAFVSFGGIGLGSITATGSVAITRADLEVSERDLTLALEAAEAALSKEVTLNKRIINTIPVEYKIDGKISWGEPVGLKAHKLEVKALFITCLEHHLGDLIKAVEEAGIEVVDVVAAPVAASFVTVSKKERRVGALLADVGAETLSVIAFENGNPVSLEVFGVGGEDITNDIALGLKVSLEEAEIIKLGGLSRSPYSKKKLDEIISARLYDCFESIEGHLKKIGRDRLLPAGIILSGGSAKIGGVKALAEEALSLPASVAEIHFGQAEKGKIKDPAWTVACGLALLGFNSDGAQALTGRKSGSFSAPGGKDVVRKLSKWFSQFLP
ncbi:cell division protein FtsA [Candidatus Parcubacteria bacterium]|nr:cell division protein FtsA [Candidatus Parcubacteria bacterium]